MRERQTDRQTDRQNERTNEFFINEGKGISTIYFFSSSPPDREGERQRGRETDRDGERQTERERDRY